MPVVREQDTVPLLDPEQLHVYLVCPLPLEQVFDDEGVLPVHPYPQDPLEEPQEQGVCVDRQVPTVLEHDLLLLPKPVHV